MLQRPDPREVAAQLGRQLKSDFPTVVVPQDLVPRTLVRKLKFSPDICLSRGDELIFVYVLVAGEIPSWIRRAKKHTGKKLKVLLLVSGVENRPSTAIAADVAEDAQKLGFGLAVVTVDGILLIFPAGFKTSPPIKCGTEIGHIPRWLYERAAAGTSISPQLKMLLERFQTKYKKATSNGEITYNRECRILTDLADSIADADSRLFFPLERLQALRDFERGGANLPARDHFFHTFNNFFSGLSLLRDCSATDLTLLFQTILSAISGANHD
jgi:hypothetical protein